MPGRSASMGTERGQAVLAALRRYQGVIAQFLPRAALAQPEAVHGARVAARRVRSLLKTYADLFEPGPVQAYRLQLRRLARLLAGCREADVLVSLILAVAADPPLPQRAQQRLRVALCAVQSGARATLQSRVASPAWGKLVHALNRAAGPAGLVLRQGVRDWQVQALAARSLNKCRKCLARSPQSPKALHALRLRIKRCRYALEALSSTRERGTAGKVMRYLLVLQSRLGEHRDIVLAREWVSQRGPDIGQATVRVLTERLGVREAQARLALGLVPA